jgi:hypothetical protein
MPEEPVEKKDTGSEFGKGLIYPLVLFLGHFQNEMHQQLGYKVFLMNKTEEERQEIMGPNPRPEMNYGHWVKDIKFWYDKIVPIRGTAEATLSSDIELFFNGASDHLYELEDTGNFVPELKQEIETLKDRALEIGHGFKARSMYKMTDVKLLHDLALKILFIIDTKIGSKPIEATWK